MLEIFCLHLTSLEAPAAGGKGQGRSNHSRPFPMAGPQATRGWTELGVGDERLREHGTGLFMSERESKLLKRGVFLWLITKKPLNLP